MYHWRRKLGLMVTSSDLTSEYEYSNRLPDGITLSCSRMMLPDGAATVESLEEMTEDIDRCARLLSSAEVDLIAYSCTTGSLIHGLGFEREIEQQIADIADVPAVATAASIQRAFDALDVESIAVATPYIEELNRREERFLSEAGYDIIDIDGVGLEQDQEICSRPPEFAYQHAQQINSQEADCVFISCTGSPTFSVIEELEADLEKPVVTSNQATLWDALRTMEVDYSTVNLGQLFEV